MNTKIILVSPQESLNVGSVARAMKNFGVKALRLVAPRNYDAARARITACHAEDVIFNVEEFESLQDALTDCSEVIGFHGKEEGSVPPRSLLPEWLSRFQMRTCGCLGLVFGPEDTGLMNEHTRLCTELVRIPTADEYVSLNLAQAVVLALSACHERGLFGSFGTEENDEIVVEMATMNEYFHLDRLISEVSKLTEFYREGTPEPVPRIMNNLVRRMRLTKREMGILLGFFGRIERVLQKRGPS
jgi:tRNA/rRNA methyltransferase